MNSAQELIEKETSSELQIVQAEIDEFRVNKFLYQLVGEQCQWQDKLLLSDQQWQDYVSSANISTWIAYYRGTIAGYFELNNEAEREQTEIVYFGLAPKFIGQGFGRYLLSQAIKSAWGIANTKRVWVHTCSLDHESALPNYQARGMKIYKTEAENSEQGFCLSTQ